MSNVFMYIVATRSYSMNTRAELPEFGMCNKCGNTVTIKLHMIYGLWCMVYV